jgi:membrane protein required for colicin V production
LIFAVLLLSVVTAFVKGVLVEIFSLVGVVAGFFIAAAEYRSVAPWIMHVVKDQGIADFVAFLLLSLVTMILAGLLGRLLRGGVHWAGLGFLDRLLGAVFGLLRGLVLVTIAVIALAAFLPRAEWLQGSRLVPWFLSAARGGSHMTSVELGERIREGIRLLRSAEPAWLHASDRIPEAAVEVQTYGWKKF